MKEYRVDAGSPMVVVLSRIPGTTSQYSLSPQGAGVGG